MCMKHKMNSQKTVGVFLYLTFHLLEVPEVLNSQTDLPVFMYKEKKEMKYIHLLTAISNY